MHAKRKGQLQNSYSIKLKMQFKIMFTKISSELKHVIDEMIPLVGAVAVAVEGVEDPPVVRHTVRHIRGDDEVLKEKTKKRDHLC